MDDDGGVLEALGDGDVEVGHVRQVKLPLLLLHLVPLVVASVPGVYLAKGFHRQKEDQLEMRHTTGEWPEFERRDESFAREHNGTSILLNPTQRTRAKRRTA